MVILEITVDYLNILYIMLFTKLDICKSVCYNYKNIRKERAERGVYESDG